MVKRKKPTPDCQLVVRGDQRELAEADLVAQIVVMLARQLAQEAASGAAIPDNQLPPPSDEEQVS